MPVQFIGMIRTDDVSEIDSAVARTVEAQIDPGFVAGFDRMLIGFHSTGPDAWAAARSAAARTEGRLRRGASCGPDFPLVHA